MHKNELEGVRARIGHVKDTVEHVRSELESSREALAENERAELDQALAEVKAADHDIMKLEDQEVAEANERVYKADPAAAFMAVFFVSLYGIVLLAVFLSNYVK